VQDDVFADHFGELAFLQKSLSEALQAGDGLVVLVGPIEGLFERLIAVVGVILGVYAIADHKNLHVLVQAIGCPKGMTVVTVDLVESSQISSNSNSLTHELTKKIQTTLSLKKHTPLGTILFLNPMMNKKYSSEVNKILI
jgi:hypothetical protein